MGERVDEGAEEGQFVQENLVREKSCLGFGMGDPEQHDFPSPAGQGNRLLDGLGRPDAFDGKIGPYTGKFQNTLPDIFSDRIKDRIGSEIQTHYPTSIKDGVEITKQEAWTNRHRDYRDHPYHYQLTFLIPKAIREIVEQIAFIAREDKRVDKRSGVSQRLPITVMESVASNAERRALFNRETVVIPRVSDIYAAIPAITGKIELEYEGEQVGAERVARDLIRKACGEVFGSRFAGIDS